MFSFCTHLDRTSHPGELSPVDFVRSSSRDLASRSISMKRRFKADASGHLRMTPHSLITYALSLRVAAYILSWQWAHPRPGSFCRTDLDSSLQHHCSSPAPTNALWTIRS